MAKENRFNFTAPKVLKAECEQGKAQSFVWDASTPCLGLRITANGSKAYIFESRVHGKNLRLTIGAPKSWTLDGARELAREWQTLCDQGIDPRDVKAGKQAEAEEKERQKLRTVVTLEQAWSEYIEARQHVWGERHLFDHHKIAQRGGVPRKRGRGVTQPGPLASLLDMRLSELTSEVIEGWLNAENETRPARAALAFRLLIGFASWCSEHKQYSDLIPEGALQAKTVRERVQKAVKQEEDCLQREQLPSWFAAVRMLGNPVMSAYLQALLLTGARREEMAALQWDDVDFRWGRLVLKDKVEGSRTIPLTPYLSALLSSLPRRNQWVFSSPASETGRIREPRIAHNRALEAAGLPHLTLHGLRRSFGTLAEWVEVPAGVVAQIQGHKPSAIAEKHYRRRPLDLLRQWHTKVEAWVLKEAGIVFSSTTMSPAEGDIVLAV